MAGRLVTSMTARRRLFMAFSIGGIPFDFCIWPPQNSKRKSLWSFPPLFPSPLFLLNSSWSLARNSHNVQAVQSRRNSTFFSRFYFYFFFNRFEVWQKKKDFFMEKIEIVGGKISLLSLFLQEFAKDIKLYIELRHIKTYQQERIFVSLSCFSL